MRGSLSSSPVNAASRFLTGQGVGATLTVYVHASPRCEISITSTITSRSSIR